jgi:hypothetical protein
MCEVVVANLMVSTGIFLNTFITLVLAASSGLQTSDIFVDMSSSQSLFSSRETFFSSRLYEYSSFSSKKISQFNNSIVAFASRNADVCLVFPLAGSRVLSEDSFNGPGRLDQDHDQSL